MRTGSRVRSGNCMALTLLEELPLTSCLLSTSGRMDHVFQTCITEEILKTWSNILLELLMLNVFSKNPTKS